MKSKTAFFLILLLLPFSLYAQKSIAVMNIQSAEVRPSNCIAITNYMTSELNRFVEYRIISWDDVSKMLEHHAGLQAIGCEDTECFAEIGGALGVDYIIAGDIGALGDRYVMTIRQIDINRAETVGRVSRRVTGNIGLLMDEIPEMVEEMFEIEDRASAGEVSNSDGNVFVIDADGNRYSTVKIGNQLWTVENLRVTSLNDGTPIPHVASRRGWRSLKGPGYCYYDNKNSEAHRERYGALYNWDAVNTGKLAPEGWRVPTIQDWGILGEELGRQAGSKMKTTGTSDWDSPNRATNESGFSALPGGYRRIRGGFSDFGSHGFWWSATERGALVAYANYISHRWSILRNRYNPSFRAPQTIYYLKKSGFSVRLVRDVDWSFK